MTDSNGDGQPDLLEWGLDPAGNLRPGPLNTDGDSLPDLFDPDNDNDSVPDRVDLAPYAKGGATYSEAAPLQLTLRNLTVGKPTFVEFQLRPSDPKNLWFAHNVLDWPQDSEGQVCDVDGKTYADVAASTGRAADASETNGDMKLVPMLEIRIPNSSANLPSQAELTPFNISVNDFTADGATKVAYVPLAIVTDAKTGERVAFSGQMRYKPTGSWNTPHSVRLAWVVQALVDQPCDLDAPNAAAQGCQRAADGNGYRYNQPTAIHSYYDTWTLTGLNVREDHGASMALVYEDPAVDPNKKDDKALWGLAYVLDHHFVAGRDENNDGQRDLKLSDFPARFDRDNNPSAAQRFEIPNLLQVTTYSYTTLDEAVAATAMTETVKVLNSAFKSVVAADNAIKPLLFFAQESNMRTIGLDQTTTTEGYATQNGANLILDLAPTAARTLPVAVQAGITWMAYCGANGSTITWRPCAMDEYAGEFERRYAALPSEPNDGDPALVLGRMALAFWYYAALTAGYNATVQEGASVISSRYSLDGESTTATTVRTVLNNLATVPLLAMQTYQRVLFIGLPSSARDTLAIRLDFNVRTIGKGLKGQYPLVSKGTAGFKFAVFGPVGAAGGLVVLLTQTLAGIPSLPKEARLALGVIGATVAVAIPVTVGAMQVVALAKLNRIPTPINQPPKPTTATYLNVINLTKGFQKLAFGVGLAISVATIWGFFIYGAATAGYGPGSPELNKAFAEALAATFVTVLLSVISTTIIGTIIIAILSLIDFILTLTCELGVKELRNAPLLGGACFTLTTSATKVIAYFLYNYEPMIDTSRSDLMVTGAPAITLADPSKGYVPANTVSLSLPITTTVVHKDPDPSAGLYINLYLYLFSPDNLRSSTFQYGLSKGAAATVPVDLNQMVGAWQNVGEDHKYVATPMYRGVAGVTPPPLTGLPLVQGINSTVPFSITMNFAVPAYECWLMPIPFGPIIVPTPICRTREFESANSTPLTVIKYDVFPPTLAGFVALGNKSDSGSGQTWDARFESLRDADGDGLRGPVYNGADPNDTLWDSDGDGLSDRFELEQRVAGIPYSPIQRDTDNDGLTDKQEAQYNTDPAIADSDNDGLADGLEVRRQQTDANGAPTATWDGGWQVTINSGPVQTIWVASNPLRADSDDDGVSDQAEKELAANPDLALRRDRLGVPYHPQVVNTPPLALFVDSSAVNGYVRPDTRLYYTSTVVASVPVEPGVLDVTTLSDQGFTPLPLALGFNPLTFSTSQTVTQGVNFIVRGGPNLQPLDLLSSARTRLQSSGASGWVSEPVAVGAALGGFAAPFSARNSTLTAARADRQDSYLLGALVANATQFTNGDVRSYNLSSGAATILENSNNTGSSYFLRGQSAPALASNTSGTTLAVWEREDRCNTLTINWFRVAGAAADVNNGIEPFLTRGSTSSQNQIWRWDTAGGTPDMRAGDQRGPNAFGFPYTVTFCDNFPLYVWESDGGGVDEAVGNLALSPLQARTNETLSFSGAGHTLEVNVTVPLKDEIVVTGALLNADGVRQSNVTFPRPPVPTSFKLEMRHPVVASNGDGFLVAYEVAPRQGATLDTATWLVTQAFDRAGNAIGNSARLAATVATPTVSARLSLDLAWVGNRYRLLWKQLATADLYYGDFNPNGSAIGNWTLLVNDATTTTSLLPDYGPKLAYDPTTGRWIMSYLRTPSATGRVLLYPSGSNNTPLGSRDFGSGLEQGFAVYHPVTRGWLVGWYDAPNLSSYPLQADLTDLAPLTAGAAPFVLAAGSIVVAPNGLINFRQNVNATGAFIGKWLLAEQNSKVTRPVEPATGGVNGELLNETAIVTTTLSETLGMTTTVSETSLVTTTVAVTSAVDLAVNELYLPLITADAVSNSSAITPTLTAPTPVTATLTTVTNTGTTESVAPESVTATPTITVTAPVTATTVGEASTAAADRLTVYLPLISAADQEEVNR